MDDLRRQMFDTLKLHAQEITARKEVAKVDTKDGMSMELTSEKKTPSPNNLKTCEEGYAFDEKGDKKATVLTDGHLKVSPGVCDKSVDCKEESIKKRELLHPRPPLSIPT